MNGVWGLVREPGAAPPGPGFWGPVLQQRREGPWTLGVVLPDGTVEMRHSTDPVQSLSEGGNVAVAALGDARMFQARGMLFAIHGGVPGKPGQPLEEFRQVHADTLAAFENPETALTVMLTGIYPVTAVVGTRSQLLVFRRGDVLYRTKGQGVHCVSPEPLGARAVVALPDRQVVVLP